jgi:hypothetical protein
MWNSCSASIVLRRKHIYVFKECTMHMVKRENRRLFGRLATVTLVLLMLTLVFSGCESVFGSSDDDDDNGGDNTSVPGTVPDDESAEAVTGESYGSMRFTDEVQTSNGGYGTDIELYSANPTEVATYDYLSVASIYDTTDSADIEPGTYSYVADGDGNSDWGTDGTFDGFTVAADYNGDENNPAADYIASVLDNSDFTGNFDLITDGTITVSKDGDTYTIEWEMTTNDEETLAGSYSGEVDGVDEP